MPAPGSPPIYAATAQTVGQAVPYSSSAAPLPEEQLGVSDGRAMARLMLAVTVGLAGAIVTFFAPYAFGYSTFSTSSLESSFSNSNVVYGFIAAVAVGGALTCVMVWFYRSTFHILAEGDPGLRTPSSLAVVAIIGVVILLAGALWLVGLAYQDQLFQCAGGAVRIPPSCFQKAGAQGYAAVGVLAVGVIVSLVGWIGGVWLGLWRLGTRYNDSLFKIGMVLSIFPLLNIIGYILLLVASRSVTTRVRTRLLPAGG